ncbi:MAG: hypothetical protein LUO93_02820 [Methanomicrobiales archaeon]|nr:hypothetical protein [Methanomicrobiales archaeon]
MTGDGFGIYRAIVESQESRLLIGHVREAGMRSACTIVCIDADRVAGMRHVESAIKHGLRSWQRGTPIADSLEMEVLLYAGGTRHTSAARVFGVSQETRNLYMCFIPFREQAFREVASWVQYTDEDWEELTATKLQNLERLFQITAEEKRAVGLDRIGELILERVALLDVNK